MMNYLDETMGDAELEEILNSAEEWYAKGITQSKGINPKNIKLHSANRNQNECHVLKRFFKSIDTPQAKRMRASHKSPDIIVEIPTENTNEPPRILRGLLDSGSILLNEFTKGLPKRFGIPERWTTMGASETWTKGIFLHSLH
jgi:hypothetical protein